MVSEGYPPGYDGPQSPEVEVNILWKGTRLDKKLSMIRIGDFSGADEDWLNWSQKVKSSFGEAGLETLLTNKKCC